MQLNASAMMLTTLTVLSALAGNAPPDMNVNVLSFNIRYGTADDGENSWPDRREMVFDVIRVERADFCGLQEALRFQIDAIRQAVPEYAEFGRARDDGQTAGEYSAILYRKDRWKLEQGETLWLSDTPEQPGSTSWGNSLPRIVTWGRFVDQQTGRAICVFNTHLDHQSQASRLKSAQFIGDLIAQKAHGDPAILTGDFNAGEQNPVVRHLATRLVDTFRATTPQAQGVGTFNGFEGRTGGDRIDYIFADQTARVKSAAIIRAHDGSRYPSDHFPVSAELVFPGD